MSEIKPALTPEEWAHLRRHGFLPHEGGDGFAALLGHGDRHKAAAVCLDGQPFGFTWEDFDRLECHDPKFRSIADRIAALLPPR